ncbi:MAG: ABC transporter permease subunit [Syntrophomonadaceae bacterium]|nr:ABC transporter permease subunit [Syntrophomonadaceae bacterium]
MQVSTIKENKERLYYIAGIILIVLGWQILSTIYNSIIIPSPLNTLEALKAMAISGELKDNIFISFRRQLGGLSLGVCFGLITGLLAGYFKRFEWLILPLINLLMSVPAIVFVVMAMVWLGLGTQLAIFIVGLLVFPVMHINTVEGLKSIDQDLIEMSRIYKLPLYHVITKIYFPGMLHGLIAGFSLALASSVRLTIMSELLGAREGIGQRIAIARAYLETEQLFAWVLVLLAILIAMEYLLIRPLKNLASRQR